MENTPFEEVYSLFLSMITDYNLAEFTEEELNEELLTHMKRALSNFINTDIKINEDIEVFNKRLSGLEINIITLGMLSSYLNQKLYNSSLLKQQLSMKDYQQFSNANMIQQISELKSKTDKEFHYYQQRYSLQQFIKER